MKIINTTVLFALLAIPAMALSSKVKSEYALVKGTSIGKYAKPGAPVDIVYTSEHMDVGDISKIDIDLQTYLKKGVMKVSISMDDALKETTNIGNDISFTLTPSTKSIPIHMKVIASEEGRYYVRLLVSIKGKGMRSFAVPVYVGKGTVTNKKPIQKTKNGENISVSRAIETIR